MIKCLIVVCPLIECKEYKDCQDYDEITWLRSDEPCIDKIVGVHGFPCDGLSDRELFHVIDEYKI
jgi:hypothetical protein